MEVDLETVIADMLLEQFNQPVKIVSHFLNLPENSKVLCFTALLALSCRKSPHLKEPTISAGTTNRLREKVYYCLFRLLRRKPYPEIDQPS